MDTIGWLGALCFSLCALPQAIQSYRQGHSKGLAWSFLLLWLAGEVLTMIYIWPKMLWPLMVNYIFNLICLLVIIRYKIKETP